MPLVVTLYPRNKDPYSLLGVQKNLSSSAAPVAATTTCPSFPACLDGWVLAGALLSDYCTSSFPCWRSQPPRALLLTSSSCRSLGDFVLKPEGQQQLRRQRRWDQLGGWDWDQLRATGVGMGRYPHSLAQSCSGPTALTG